MRNVLRLGESLREIEMLLLSNVIPRLQKINPRFADEKNSILTYFQANLLA